MIGRGVRSQRGELDAVDVASEAEFVHEPDAVPIEIDFVPAEAVARGDWMRVMIIVPAFAPAEDGDPPTVR